MDTKDTDIRLHLLVLLVYKGFLESSIHQDTLRGMRLLAEWLDFTDVARTDAAYRECLLQTEGAVIPAIMGNCTLFDLAFIAGVTKHMIYKELVTIIKQEEPQNGR